LKGKATTAIALASEGISKGTKLAAKFGERVVSFDYKKALSKTESMLTKRLLKTEALLTTIGIPLLQQVGINISAHDAHKLFHMISDLVSMDKIRGLAEVDWLAIMMEKRRMLQEFAASIGIVDVTDLMQWRELLKNATKYIRVGIAKYAPSFLPVMSPISFLIFPFVLHFVFHF